MVARNELLRDTTGASHSLNSRSRSPSLDRLAAASGSVPSLLPAVQDAFGRESPHTLSLLPWWRWFPSLLLARRSQRLGSTWAAVPIAPGSDDRRGARGEYHWSGCWRHPLAGLVLMPAMGLHVTMIVAVLAPRGWASCRGGTFESLGANVDAWSSQTAQLAPAAAALLIVLGTLPAWPRDVFAAGIGFFAPRYEDQAVGDIANGMHLVYYRDGASATMSVDETGQTLFYRSNGKTEASTDPVDVPNQLLLGHLPMLLHPGARDVFLFGLGTGMTAAAVARYPVQQIDIVEPERAVVPAARFFDSYTGKVLDDSRVHLIFGDGRDRLQGMPKQYDVVISDISDIWVAGASASATIEHYRAVAERLKPGGVFAQRIDTHALVPDDLELLTATCCFSSHAGLDVVTQRFDPVGFSRLCRMGL